MPLIGTCGSCEYWYNNSATKRTECHRHPPLIAVSTSFSMWPAVRATDCCGFWELSLARATYVSDWTFNAAAYVPPPPSGRVRFNANPQNAATTIIYISVQDQNAVDQTTALTPLLKAGKILHFEEKADPSKFKNYLLTADAQLIAGTPSYFQCAVSFLVGGTDIGSNVMKVQVG